MLKFNECVVYMNYNNILSIIIHNDDDDPKSSSSSSSLLLAYEHIKLLMQLILSQMYS